MSTTVSYKGQTLTTANNETKVLETAGTWLEDDITIVDVSSGGATEGYTLTNIVPSQSVTATTAVLSAYMGLITTYTDILELGEAYLVTYDGDEYVLWCYEGWSQEYLIGDNQIVDSTNIGRLTSPFTIDYGVVDDELIFISRDTTAHTIKVDKITFIDPTATLVTKSITQNGTYNASSDTADGYSSVTVNVSGSSPMLQAKTATPTDTSQTITADSGYDGLSSVSVEAVKDCSIKVLNASQQATIEITGVQSRTIFAVKKYYVNANTSIIIRAVDGGIIYYNGVIVAQNMSSTASYTFQMPSGNIEVSADNSANNHVYINDSIVPSGSINITQNGTVDVSQYASASVAVSGGSTVKTGSVTFDTTYSSTGNRTITTTSNIGFTPKRFYLVIHDKSVVSGKQYAILRASFETGADNAYYRTTTRYSNTSNSLSTSVNGTNWTTQANYYLYLDNGTIYIRTTNTFILNAGTTYDWIAIA